MPMRILFLAANPIDTDQLRLGEEMREIDQRLLASKLRDQFELEAQFAVRHSDLAQGLLRYTPHIVHFSGHGSPRGEIIVEDEAGKAHPVNPEVLARLFGVLKDNIRCIVMNACWTVEQAEAIAEVIDCVVGMSRAISDDAAIDFAGGFYQALGYGRSIQQAFELGCIQIGLDSIPEEATPRLIGRSGIDMSGIYITEA